MLNFFFCIFHLLNDFNTFIIFCLISFFIIGFFSKNKMCVQFSEKENRKINIKIKLYDFALKQFKLNNLQFEFFVFFKLLM